jgi:hypothetical protein
MRKLVKHSALYILSHYIYIYIWHSLSQCFSGIKKTYEVGGVEKYDIAFKQARNFKVIS